ncbi:4300_t:CDS:2, partial [Acaulospora morrowiae]
MTSRNLGTLIYREIMNESLDNDIELGVDRNPNSEEEEDNDETEDRYDKNMMKKANTISRKINKRAVVDVFDNNSAAVSVQNIYLEEEDLNLFLTGYRFNRYGLYTYYILCVLTGGVLLLLSRWMPKLWIWLVGNVSDMEKAEWVVVENQWGELSIENVLRKYYGGTVISVFSFSQLDDDDAARLTSLSPDEILSQLQYFDYRFIRFIYNPLLGKFLQNSYWKDPTWTSVKSLKKGITREIYNEPRQISSEDLVPGDIFEISDPDLHIYPCDAVLLSGD